MGNQSWPYVPPPSQPQTAPVTAPVQYVLRRGPQGNGQSSRGARGTSLPPNSQETGEGFRMAQFMLSLALADGPSRNRTPSSRNGRGGGDRPFSESAIPVLPAINHLANGHRSEQSENNREPSSGLGALEATVDPTPAARIQAGLQQPQRIVPDSSSGGDVGDAGSFGLGSANGAKTPNRTEGGRSGRASVAFSDEPDTLAAIEAEIERRTKQLELLMQQRNELVVIIEREKQAEESNSEHSSLVQQK